MPIESKTAFAIRLAASQHRLVPVPKRPAPPKPKRPRGSPRQTDYEAVFIFAVGYARETGHWPTPKTIQRQFVVPTNQGAAYILNWVKNVSRQRFPHTLNTPNAPKVRNTFGVRK